MERSAIYRRQLGPIMTSVGVTGIVAAVLGGLLKIQGVRAFGIYWMAVAAFAVLGAFLLVRRQALKDREPFWSPPTRRIALAMFPALLAGLAYGVAVVANHVNSDDPRVDLVYPAAWILLYGLALHAAGFFMPRGIRLFGWIFIVAGLVMILGMQQLAGVPAHLLMGAVFGGLHLAYGIYLFFTEPRKNAA
jgi:hypothetical protein